MTKPCSRTPPVVFIPVPWTRNVHWMQTQPRHHGRVPACPADPAASCVAGIGGGERASAGALHTSGGSDPPLVSGGCDVRGMCLIEGESSSARRASPPDPTAPPPPPPLPRKVPTPSYLLGLGLAEAVHRARAGGGARRAAMLGDDCRRQRVDH
jgi:hypothetical protein